MATKKKTTKAPKSSGNFTSPLPSKESDQTRINELVNNSYQNGKDQGKQEALEIVYGFLKQKSVDYFMDNKDDIAKIVRDLCNDVKNAIPK